MSTTLIVLNALCRLLILIIGFGLIFVGIGILQENYVEYKKAKDTIWEDTVKRGMRRDISFSLLYLAFGAFLLYWLV